MSQDVVFGLYYYSAQTPFFWVDDVYVFGILGAKLGVRHIDFNEKLSLDDDRIEEWLADDKPSLPPLFVHPHSIKHDNITISLWNKTARYYSGSY